MEMNPENIGSTEPATRGDIEELREDLQADLQELETRLTVQAADAVTDLKAMIAASEKHLGQKLDDILEHIDAAVEARDIELGAAKKEAVQLHGEQIESLRDDVKQLQQIHNISADH